MPLTYTQPCFLSNAPARLRIGSFASGWFCSQGTSRMCRRFPGFPEVLRHLQRFGPEPKGLPVDRLLSRELHLGKLSPGWS